MKPKLPQKGAVKQLRALFKKRRNKKPSKELVELMYNSQFESYADKCLDIAKKATEGPWETYQGSGCHYKDGVRIKNYLNYDNDIIGASIDYRQAGVNTEATAEFIAASREMVPELVRRLKRACDALRLIQTSIENSAIDTVWIADCSLNMTACDYIQSLVDELEVIPNDNEKLGE